MSYPTPPAHLDEPTIRHNRQIGAKRIAEEIPPRFAHAEPDHPAVAAWAREVLLAAYKSGDPISQVRTGPSLLLLGPTGVGKTHQCYGAKKWLHGSPGRVYVTMSTAADVYAALRPRYGSDPEEVFRRYASVGVLMLDDIGSEKTSEWVEEVNYRLINHRYEYMRPTVITSNLPPRDLSAHLGSRVMSRIAEMASTVVLNGQDRRVQ